MKQIAFSLLALTLSLTAFVPIVKAETSPEYQLTPFNLTSLAYQGRLTNNGIPGYSALESGVNLGSITAEDVIGAAIESGRLSEAALQDTQFVTAVEHRLESLVERN